MTTPDTPVILVTIPDCTATHVLGSTAIPLISGPLSLLKSPALAAPSISPIDIRAPGAANAHSPTTSSAPVLTLQIGKLAFPLMKDTLFGTDAASPRAYLFAPELGPPGQATKGGYVRLELPEHAQKAVAGGKESPQDTFEQALIEEGLLKQGWEAVRDEIGRGVKNTVGGVADKVSGSLATESGRVPPEAIEPDPEDKEEQGRWV